MRSISLLARKAALAHLLRGIYVGILLNEHITADCPTVLPELRASSAQRASYREDRMRLPIRAGCGLRR